MLYRHPSRVKVLRRLLILTTHYYCQPVFSARQHVEHAIFTTGLVFVFGPVTVVLFGRIRIHYSAHYSARIEYEQNIRYSPNYYYYYNCFTALWILSGINRVNWYQKGKTNLDFTEVRDIEWQWYQLGHMQMCTSSETDNTTSTPPLMLFTGWTPFLPPNQQCQSTEGILKAIFKLQTRNYTY